MNISAVEKMKENYQGKSLNELEAILDAAKADLGKGPSSKPPMNSNPTKRNSSTNEEG